MAGGKLSAAAWWWIIGIGALILLGGGAAVMVTSGGLSGIINAIALAIQKAEGGNPGDQNMRINNPGNITDMGRPGQTGTFTNPLSGITFPVFDTYADGFAALVWKVTRAMTGQSATYPSSMSLSQFFQTYSGDQNEAQNVADTLGVDPDTTLADLAASADSSGQA
jgi:hypothetical protein